MIQRVNGAEAVLVVDGRVVLISHARTCWLQLATTYRRSSSFTRAPNSPTSSRTTSYSSVRRLVTLDHSESSVQRTCHVCSLELLFDGGVVGFCSDVFICTFGVTASTFRMHCRRFGLCLCSSKLPDCFLCNIFRDSLTIIFVFIIITRMWADAQRGPMPNAMAARPNIGGALCESCVIPFLVPRCKVWLTPSARVSCSNAANIGQRKTWTQS